MLRTQNPCEECVIPCVNLHSLLNYRNLDESKKYIFFFFEKEGKNIQVELANCYDEQLFPLLKSLICLENDFVIRKRRLPASN